MNKIKLICVLAAVLLLGAAANAASLRVGLCDGQLATTGQSKAGKATVKAATVLPAELMQQYAGAEVTAIRVGLVTADGIANFSAWLADTVGGDALNHASATPVAGWNEIALPAPTAVDGSAITVGFTFEQTKSVKCISAVGEKNVPGGLWMAKNDAWEDKSDLGLLSVELVLSSPSFPATDLALTSLSFSPQIVQKGESTEMRVAVKNVALDVIDGFDWEYSIDGVAVQQHSDLRLEPYASAVVTAEIGTGDLQADQNHTVAVKLSLAADGNNANDEAQRLLGVYETTMPRLLLIEEFTTEDCPNCPRAINTLHQAQEDGYGNQFVVLAHHVGYGTDWLTVEQDEQLLWFYNGSYSGGTFAPAVMLDRTVMEGNSSPVESIGYWNTFKPRLLMALAEPAFVQVQAAASLDPATRQLTVDVSANALAVFESLCTNPRINVFVMEDSILHHNQAGISSNSFKHNHVNRINLTGIYGDEFDLASGSASASYQVQLAEDWVADNLHVVAFVSSFNQDDLADCRVFNTAVVSLGGGQGVAGDVNGDGLADASDVTALIGVITGAAASDRADVNGDGLVDASDVTALIAIVLGN